MDEETLQQLEREERENTFDYLTESSIEEDKLEKLFKDG